MTEFMQRRCIKTFSIFELSSQRKNDFVQGRNIVGLILFDFFDLGARLVEITLGSFLGGPFVYRFLKFLEIQIVTLLGIKNDKRTGNEAFYRFILIFFVLFH